MRHPCNAISILLCAAALLGAGCASVKVRASESFTRENPVRKVAVIASGQVVWPRRSAGRLGDADWTVRRGFVWPVNAVLDLSDTKKALGVLVPKACRALSKKGYEVVFCEPAGIGYDYRGLSIVTGGSEEFRTEEEFDVDKPSKEQGSDGAPKDNAAGKKKFLLWLPRDFPYDYPIIKDVGEARAAAQHIFGEDVLTLKAPSKDDIEALARFTGADTLCIQYVYGVKFSSGRQAAYAARVLAAGIGGVGVDYRYAVTDRVHVLLTCVKASTSEVLWQHETRMNGNPTDPGVAYSQSNTFDPSYDTLQPANVTIVEDTLKYFPRVGKPLDAELRSK